MSNYRIYFKQERNETSNVTRRKILWGFVLETFLSRIFVLRLSLTHVLYTSPPTLIMEQQFSKVIGRLFGEAQEIKRMYHRPGKFLIKVSQN